jgi:hypothetical protein
MTENDKNWEMKNGNYSKKNSAKLSKSVGIFSRVQETTQD